jgi:hypothetical protein
MADAPASAAAAAQGAPTAAQWWAPGAGRWQGSRALWSQIGDGVLHEPRFRKGNWIRKNNNKFVRFCQCSKLEMFVLVKLKLVQQVRMIKTKDVRDGLR